MSTTKVALLGATGETGTSILNGLLEDGSFTVTILVRPSSAHKPAVQKLAARGLSILEIDTETSINPDILKPFEVVLSAIGPEGQLSQLNLATAAAAAGVKRFVPCGYITICPPGGIMDKRDQKEEVHNHIFRLKLPYTIIDTGFWHQLSFPKLASGRTDSVHLYGGENVVYAGGEAKTLLTDLRDIGRWVARIVRDERTLNKRVVVWSDELSQREIFGLCGEMAGEEIPYTTLAATELVARFEAAKEAYRKSIPADHKGPITMYNPERMALSTLEYAYSKYAREDNTRSNALYLGYVDGRELIPNFKPILFREYFREALDGGGERPYKDKYGQGFLAKKKNDEMERAKSLI